jgi:hypothetical protein
MRDRYNHFYGVNDVLYHAQIWVRGSDFALLNEERQRPVAVRAHIHARLTCQRLCFLECRHPY